jgi:hypothetical protein
MKPPPEMRAGLIRRLFTAYGLAPAVFEDQPSAEMSGHGHG